MGAYSEGAESLYPWTVTVRAPDLVEWDGQVDGYDNVQVDLTDPVPGADPGTWEITLPRSHWAAHKLAEEGAGIVFRPAGSSEVIASGDWETYTEQVDGPRHTITFKGNVDDDCLNGEEAWADPAHDLNDPTGNNPVPDAADIRSGPAETVLKGFITANLKSSSPAHRLARLWPWLDVPASAGLGNSVSLRGQFDKMYEIAQQAASPTTGITWQIKQHAPGVLRLVVRARVDRSANIVFSQAEGTLGRSTLTRRRPAVTQAIAVTTTDTVRLFARVTDSAAESRWMRRRAVMVDGSTDVISELTTVAAEAITAGREKAGLTCEPVALSSGPRFAIDYQLGDYVGAVTTSGGVIEDVLTQVSYHHNSGSGPTITPSIGVNRVDESDALVPIVRNLDRYARRNEARS